MGFVQVDMMARGLGGRWNIQMEVKAVGRGVHDLVTGA